MTCTDIVQTNRQRRGASVMVGKQMGRANRDLRLSERTASLGPLGELKGDRGKPCPGRHCPVRVTVLVTPSRDHESISPTIAIYH